MLTKVVSLHLPSRKIRQSLDRLVFVPLAPPCAIIRRFSFLYKVFLLHLLNAGVNQSSCPDPGQKIETPAFSA